MDPAAVTELERLRQRIAQLEGQLACKTAIDPQFPVAVYALALENLSEGVIISDDSGTILFTNTALSRMLGYQEAELQGTAIASHLAEQDGHNEIVRVTAALASAPSWQGEWINRKKDGGLLHTAVRIVVHREKNRSYWICVQEDISERRRTETELRDANAKLRALIQASPLPIIAFDRQGLINLWNASAQRVFGWEEAEVLGKPLPFIPEESLAEHRSMRSRDLSGEGFTNREVRRRRKDGTPIDISVSTAPIHNAAGEVTGVMSVYVDITQQKRYAAEQQKTLQMFRQMEQQLTLLVEASGALLAAPELQPVVQTVLGLAQRFVEAEAYAVWRKRGSLWKVIASTGLSESYNRTTSHPSLAQSLPEQPLTVEDVYQSSFLGFRAEFYRAEGIQSVLIVPLRIHGEIGGMIVFYYRSKHAFTEPEQQIGGALGNLAAAAITAAEIYERQAELREAAEAAERRSAFLAAVGAELVSSLDYEAGLTSITKLAVPDIADWCTVDMLEADGTIRRLAVQHVDPERVEFAYEFSRRYPPTEDELSRTVLRTAEPVLITHVPDALLIARARDPEHLAMMRKLGLRSIICAPMVVRGRALGVITFVRADSGRHFGTSDLSMAVEIARRAAVAVDNALLFREVRESEERFRRLYDSNIVAIAFWNVDGRVTSANDACLDILRMSREQFEANKGVAWAQITPAGYDATDTRMLAECLQFGVSRVHEKEYLRSDGTRATVLIAAAFLSPARTEGVAFVVDITERKKLDLQFRALADAAVAISAAPSVPEIVQTVQERLQLLVPECRSEILLAGDNSLPPKNFVFCVPLKNRAGQNIGALYLGRNGPQFFTENDRAIVIQLAEMASIAIENTQLTVSLKQSNEDLQRANEDLNQFAYSASHDLQEPLRMISIYTEMTARKLGPKADEDAHQYMRFTLDGARRMEMLIRDLLAYTQAVNIRGIPDVTADANVALQKALDNLRSAIVSSGAMVEACHLPPVRAFEIHVVQLLQNLIGNAIKYRGPEAPIVRVSVRRESDSDYWAFTVEDNGIGISPKYQQQIFGLFRRLHTTQQYPGTGIGLAICQKVVERYGGRLSVESDVGQGAKFIFTLPA